MSWPVAIAGVADLPPDGLIHKLRWETLPPPAGSRRVQG
jgi:hypothetical protein